MPGNRLDRAAFAAGMIALCLLPTAFSGDSITFLVKNGNDGAAGFGVIEPGPHDLQITLQASGAGNDVVWSVWWDDIGVVLWTPWDNYQQQFTHLYNAYGVYAEDMFQPIFDGQAALPGPNGEDWFTLMISQIDLDVGLGDDETEATDGAEVAVTDPGPDLPDTFAAGTTTGELLWLNLSSNNAGTLRIEVAGNGAAVYREDPDTFDWHKVVNDIPVTDPWSIPPLELHTDNNFTGNVYITVKFFPDNKPLYAGDRVKLFPEGSLPPINNYPPEFQDETTPGNYQFRIGEGSQVDAVVGEVTATDLEGDALIYTITGGNDAGLFRIDVDANQRAWLTVATDLPLDDMPATSMLTIEVADVKGGKDTSSVTNTTRPMVAVGGDIHGTESASPIDPIVLTIVRFAKDKTNPLRVYFTFDGGLPAEVDDPANALVDGYVEIPALTDRVTLTLQPFADGLTEGMQKFRIDLSPSPTYVITPNSVIIDKKKKFQKQGWSWVHVYIVDAFRLFAPFNATKATILTEPDLRDKDNVRESVYDPKASQPGPPVDAGVSLNDITQGKVGDCYLMAAFGAVALRDPDEIRQRLTFTSGGKLKMHFFPQLNQAATFHEVDFTLDKGYQQAYLSEDDSDNENGGKGAFNEVWPTMVEKLYIDFVGESKFYHGDDDEWIYRIWEQIYNTEHYYVNVSLKTGAQIETLLRTEAPVAGDPANTGKLVFSVKAEGPGKEYWRVTDGFSTWHIHGNHAYVVMRVDDNGTPADTDDDRIRIYNPWGGEDSVKLYLPFSEIKRLRLLRYVYHD
ncbi:MAG: hypothetical protein ACE5KM_17755 [Planctomycetaceae bacterium]